VGVMRPGSPAIVLAAVASHDQPCVVAHKIGKIAAELHLATELVSLRLTRAQDSPEPPRSCSAVKCEFAHLRRRRDVSSSLGVRGGKHHPLPTLPHRGEGSEEGN
jgi:hypothetical protein